MTVYLESRPIRVQNITHPAPLRVERVAAGMLYAITAEWSDLCDRAIESNVFLEPAFALPLMRHLAPTRRPGVVLVWEDGDSARLLALMPVAAPGRRGLAWAFDDEQVALGTPLLDRERGAEAFAAILATLATRWPRAHALVLTRLPAEGAVARLVTSVSRTVAVLDEHERAVLARVDEASLKPETSLSSKGRKELRRQHARLAEKGCLAYREATSPEAVARATEDFLALEQRGWKGAANTALLSAPERAAFARSATRRMADAGLCRIDTLSLDGEPLAMGIVLTVRGRAHWWKTAYDERFAALSPGVHFAAELTRRQERDPLVRLTDSCAVAGHPMIDRLWRGRMGLVDLAVSLRPKPTRGFVRAVRLERGRRALRAWLKARLSDVRRRLRRH